ncbi:MAG TPA: PEP/pyruvate-binding domain-containing protein [Kofleriaceae bacterium]|nr:PEP/pyruvate-binding domain-containing protein [Kofleriaceae bacterium]
MWVHDLRDADASCGGKAVGLGRLLAAGLPVPPGFVIDDRAFRSVVGELAITDTAHIGHVLEEAAQRIAIARLPPELLDAVGSRAHELGHVVMVRSSATIEDGAAGSAAGVFSSRTAVPVDEVWDAIRAVWQSALTPLAAAYALRRGGTIAIGVIVQEYVSGTPLVVYTRPPGQPASREILIQHHDHVTRHSRDDLPREIEHQHAAVLALRAETALDQPHGVDVELVQLRKQSGFDVAIETMIVQARPIVHPTTRTLAAPPPAVIAPLADGRTWTWDVAHNPDPLSVAQQGLVERVERAGIAPWSLRICAGFLYSAPRGEELPIVRDAAELIAHATELQARLERTLVDGGKPLPLAEAVERYLAFYAIWARELSPLISAARAMLPAKLRAHGSAHPDAIAASLVERPASTVEATLRAAARGDLDDDVVEARLGVLAPAWDVVAPTYAERPGLLRDAIARAKLTQQERARDDRKTGEQPAVPNPALFAEHAVEVDIARVAADLAERDDMLFARAQWIVRRALLARSSELKLRGDDIFWLPLDETIAATAFDPDDAHRRAAGARAAAERAAQWEMPIVVGGDAAKPGPSLRGVGTGARVAGRVVRFASLASAIAVGSGDVVVTRAVTPALAVLVAGCAALVSETGGLLDHGAALARELGIPCVVGCRDAWTKLSDGMIVTVDGDGGTVTPSSDR